jgi:hypothetical protein
MSAFTGALTSIVLRGRNENGAEFFRFAPLTKIGAAASHTLHEVGTVPSPANLLSKKPVNFKLPVRPAAEPDGSFRHAGEGQWRHL